jgi:site-specific DNA recombinase
MLLGNPDRPFGSINIIITIIKNMANPNKKPKHNEEYLIYTRKSTDDTENQKNSIDYQKKQCLNFAENQQPNIANFDLKHFCTNGIIEEKHSAFKTSDINITTKGMVEYKIERPKFQVLVQRLLANEFKGVICLCWDRISRNDQDDVVIKNLMNKGIDIKFVQANYEKSSSGALHRDIDGMFAGHYSRVISEKVKLTFEKLKSEGKCTYTAPIGYLDQGSDNKPLDPERAPKVKRIFELYATGEWSLSQLAKWADKHGLTTKPSRKRRTREEILSGISLENIPKAPRPLNNKTVENILRNPFYIGKLRTNKKDYSEYIDGQYNQPLVDVSLFNKVQEVLKSKNVSIKYIDKDFYTYRGLIRCNCGRGFSPYTKKEINYYRVRCIDSCNNPDKNLNEDNINQAVEKLLSKIHFTKDELKEINKRAKTGLDNINTNRSKELDDLNIQRKRVYDDLNYLTKNKITLLRNKAMAIEQINQEEIRLKNELTGIDKKTTAHQEGASEMLKYIVTFSELVKMANLYYKHALDTEKREIATQVFTELIFENKKLVNYVAKDGFKALLERHPKENTLANTASVLSGSASRIRTDDLLVTSNP